MLGANRRCSRTWGYARDRIPEATWQSLVSMHNLDSPVITILDAEEASSCETSLRMIPVPGISSHFPSLPSTPDNLQEASQPLLHRTEPGCR
eukprot:761689-Hanusia_phi.AAC.2